MEFKFNTAVFKNKEEDNKNNNPNFPTHGGIIKLPLSQLESFVEYLHWAARTDLETDSYLNEKCIPVKLSGWARKKENKETKEVTKYMSLTLEAHYKTKNAAQEAKEASELAAPAPTASDAAASLAKSTAGAVVESVDDEPF